MGKKGKKKEENYHQKKARGGNNKSLGKKGMVSSSGTWGKTSDKNMSSSVADGSII